MHRLVEFWVSIVWLLDLVFKNDKTPIKTMSPCSSGCELASSQHFSRQMKWTTRIRNKQTAQYCRVQQLALWLVGAPAAQSPILELQTLGHMLNSHTATSLLCCTASFELKNGFLAPITPGIQVYTGPHCLRFSLGPSLLCLMATLQPSAHRSALGCDRLAWRGQSSRTLCLEQETHEQL